MKKELIGYEYFYQFHQFIATKGGQMSGSGKLGNGSNRLGQNRQGRFGEPKTLFVQTLYFFINN